MRRWLSGMAALLALPPLLNCSARRGDEAVSGTVVTAPAVGTAVGATVRSAITGAAASRARLTPLGRGDAEPIAANDTDAGRQWNRRVEVAIYADEATRFGSRDWR